MTQSPAPESLAERITATLYRWAPSHEVRELVPVVGQLVALARREPAEMSHQQKALMELSNESERLGLYDEPAAPVGEPQLPELADRCRVALQCVPESQFRHQLARLFQDLLGQSIAPVAAATHPQAPAPEVQNPEPVPGVVFHPDYGVSLVTRGEEDEYVKVQGASRLYLSAPSQPNGRGIGESEQRARMEAKFFKRPTSPSTADFDLPAESDSVAQPQPNKEQP